MQAFTAIMAGPWSFLFVLFFAVFVVFPALYYALLRYRYRPPREADEVHPVTTEDRWTIMLYRHRPKGGGGEPVLLAHGAFANHFNFNTPEGGSLADVLTEAGYDCWLIDFRGCRSSIPAPGASRNDVTMDDYLLRDIPAAVEYIRKRTGYDQIHWIGHSMGGMLLYAYDLVFGAVKVASATTLGAPVGFTDLGFSRMRPLVPLVRYARPLICALIRMLPFFLVRSRALSRRLPAFPVNWDNMSPALGARWYFHVIDPLPWRVGENLLDAAITNKWRFPSAGAEIFGQLNDLEVPLFAIYGAADPLTPRTIRERFFERIPHEEKRVLVLSKKNGHAADYNHIDLAFGRNGRRDVYEPIVSWLREFPITSRIPLSLADADDAELIAEEISPLSEEEASEAGRRITALVMASAKLAAAFSEGEGEPEGESAAAREPASPKSAKKKSAAKHKAASASKSSASKRPAVRRKKSTARKRAADGEETAP